MKVYQALIRSNSPHGFRSGEWAAIAGIVLVEPEGKEMRHCYHVVFPDGATDYWCVSEKYDITPNRQELVTV